MKAKLKAYSTQENYEKGYASKEEPFLSIGEALETAKKNIAKVRNTHKYLAYRIYDRDGELRYKLPC